MAMRSFLQSRRSLSRSLLHPDLLRSLNPNSISRPLIPALLSLRSYSPASDPTTKNPIRDAAAEERNGFKSSLNPVEVAKFAAIAETWWDPEGPFKPLHLMNPTRISFIRSTLCRHFRRDPYSPRPFEGLKILDVGCGGGILSEPLARLGADVTGIDAVEKNINIARVHAASDPLTSSIDYTCTTAEDLVRENQKFDAVISLEVIEHVADPLDFCKSLAALSVPGGAVIISTINRTMRAYATTIVAAEYILNWLPKGTHEWSKFVTPEELALILQRASVSVQEMAGFVYNPLTGNWSLSDDISINYIAFGIKEGSSDSEKRRLVLLNCKMQTDPDLLFYCLDNGQIPYKLYSPNEAKKKTEKEQ